MDNKVKKPSVKEHDKTDKFLEWMNKLSAGNPSLLPASPPKSSEPTTIVVDAFTTGIKDSSSEVPSIDTLEVDPELSSSSHVFEGGLSAPPPTPATRIEEDAGNKSGHLSTIVEATSPVPSILAVMVAPTLSTRSSLFDSSQDASPVLKSTAKITNFESELSVNKTNNPQTDLGARLKLQAMKEDQLNYHKQVLEEHRQKAEATVAQVDTSLGDRAPVLVGQAKQIPMADLPTKSSRYGDVDNKDESGDASSVTHKEQNHERNHRQNHTTNPSSFDTESFPPVADESTLISDGGKVASEQSESQLQAEAARNGSNSLVVSPVVSVQSRMAKTEEETVTEHIDVQEDLAAVPPFDLPSDKSNVVCADNHSTKDKTDINEDRTNLSYFNSWGKPTTRENRPARIRQIILTDLPLGADLTLVQSLIHGGAIDRMALAPSGKKAFVTFTSADGCEAYYQAYPNGVLFKWKGRNRCVFVDKSKDVDVVSGILQGYLNCGASRVVRATGADEEWSMRALDKIASGPNDQLKIESINDVYRNEVRTIIFRFTNISDAVVFRGILMRDCIPLALNFIASALGSGILFTYPNIAAIAGVQGLIVYVLASSLPLLIFAILGPIIRRKCPEGFVLTEWTRQRYGVITALYLSVLTLITIWLYMVAELSALQQVVNLLTGLNGLPAVIVECAVTTIYTALGGFRVSFITDNIQGAMVLGLIIVGVITVGVKVDVDRSLIPVSNYLEPSLLGWQLIYILPVAILTNDFFLSGFWMRTFAAKTDKDLWVGVSIATVLVTIILTLVGAAGLLAGWSGVLGNPPEPTGIELFQLLQTLPGWVVGIVLVMVVCLSTAAFDSLQSAIVSTGSNDLFRNKLNLWVVRGAVVVLIVPTVIVALKSPSVLQIYLISDLISASSIPVLVIGLSSRCYWWRGFEVVVGGLGGILTIFLFGLVFYDGDASSAGALLILTEGLYVSDWSAFGAFVAAPIGGLVWAFGAFVLRISVQWTWAKIKGHRFDALDRPAAPDASFYTGSGSGDEREHVTVSGHDGVERSVVDVKGKFF